MAPNTFTRSLTFLPILTQSCESFREGGILVRAHVFCTAGPDLRALSTQHEVGVWRKARVNNGGER